MQKYKICMTVKWICTLIWVTMKKSSTNGSSTSRRVRGTTNCSHYNSMTLINQNERKCYVTGIYLPVSWVGNGWEHTNPLPLLRSTGPGMTNFGAHIHVNASNYTTANHLTALCHLFTLATGTTNQPSALCASPVNQHSLVNVLSNYVMKSSWPS